VFPNEFIALLVERKYEGGKGEGVAARREMMLSEMSVVYPFSTSSSSSSLALDGGGAQRSRGAGL
jgi:hypothetical protein